MTGPLTILFCSWAQSPPPSAMDILRQKVQLERHVALALLSFRVSKTKLRCFIQSKFKSPYLPFCSNSFHHTLTSSLPTWSCRWIEHCDWRIKNLYRSGPSVFTTFSTAVSCSFSSRPCSLFKQRKIGRTLTPFISPSFHLQRLALAIMYPVQHRRTNSPIHFWTPPLVWPIWPARIHIHQAFKCPKVFFVFAFYL